MVLAGKLLKQRLQFPVIRHLSHEQSRFEPHEELKPNVERLIVGNRISWERSSDAARRNLRYLIESGYFGTHGTIDFSEEVFFDDLLNNYDFDNIVSQDKKRFLLPKNVYNKLISMKGIDLHAIGSVERRQGIITSMINRLIRIATLRKLDYIFTYANTMESLSLFRKLGWAEYPIPNGKSIFIKFL